MLPTPKQTMLGHPKIRLLPASRSQSIDKGGSPTLAFTLSKALCASNVNYLSPSMPANGSLSHVACRDDTVVCNLASHVSHPSLVSISWLSTFLIVFIIHPVPGFGLNTSFERFDSHVLLLSISCTLKQLPHGLIHHHSAFITFVSGSRRYQIAHARSSP